MAHKKESCGCGAVDSAFPSDFGCPWFESRSSEKLYQTTKRPIKLNQAYI